MQQDWKIQEIDTEIWSEEIVTRDDNEDLDVDWKIILKCILKK
jgi:hypothetical protein